MNENELLETMVKRLAAEVKGLLEQVRQGQVSAAAWEGLLREQLWHFGNQALGVLLEAWDRQLVAGQAVHDRRRRTVVSLFGSLDVSRARCQDGRYPLDEALGLTGRQGWTAAVQEACSLLSGEAGFATVSDLMGRPVVAGGGIVASGEGQAGGGDGRRGALDLELGGGALSANGRDCGLLPRPGAPVADRRSPLGPARHLGGDQGLSAAPSPSAATGAGRSGHRCPRRRAKTPGGEPVGNGGDDGATEPGILPSQPPADAV